MNPTLLVMTTNPSKLRQFHQFLGEIFTLVSAADVNITMPEETGTTLAENAEIKALSGWKQTGMPTIADDTGLSVDALGGDPGVWSARYAGIPKNEQRNRELLLHNLKDVPLANRTAHFACVLAITTSNGEIQLFHGRHDGVIAEKETGTNHPGAGYNSIFLLPDGRSLAELSPEEKNLINHRSHALRQVKRILTP